MITESPLLIFDDCFSSLDSKTEKKIIHKIIKNKKNKTTIISSNKISTLKYCDKIILLIDGQINDKDSLANMIKNNKNFKKLFKNQLTHN